MDDEAFHNTLLPLWTFRVFANLFFASHGGPCEHHCCGLSTGVRRLTLERLFLCDIPPRSQYLKLQFRHVVHVRHFLNFIPTRSVDHDVLVGIRIGEARNPGPDPMTGSVVAAMLNPTAVAGKKEALLTLQADILGLSETSATSCVQHEFSEGLTASPYRILWGRAVDAKIKSSNPHLDRPSRRGDALGTAIMSKLHFRPARLDHDGVLFASCRFCSCVCQMGSCEILFVSAYFFPGRTLEAQNKNEVLLSQIYHYIAHTSMPFIIAADFNQRVQTLTAWTAFEGLGCVEGFAFAQHRLGKTLPPTCRNATRFDSFIFHPFVADRIQDMWVGEEHTFADHSPIFARIRTNSQVSGFTRLYVPADWTIFEIDSAIFESSYSRIAEDEFLVSHIRSTSSPQQKMQVWSAVVEKSLHRTLQAMHNKDPIRWPQKGLPPHFRGRCCPPVFRREPVVRSAQHDCTKAFNPTGEPTRLQTLQKVRQTRRLASLFRQYNRKLCLYDCFANFPCQCQTQLHAEWQKILKAQGFGRSWSHWIQSFECIPYVPLTLPDVSLMHLMLQITQYDTNLAVRQEERQRRCAHKHQILIDKTENNGALIFRALRDTDQKVISGMPCPTQCEAKLIRLAKGRVRLLLTTSVSFVPGKALYGDLPVTIIRQTDRLVEIDNPTGILALRAMLVQHQYTEQIDKLSVAFFDFWNPMWQRDSTLEASSQTPWESTLREVLGHIPAQPPVSLRWDDPEIISQTISRMKSHKAPGVDGWRAQELKLLPWSAICHLALIFSTIWSTQFTAEQMLARTILLAKVPVPETFSDGRPITILGYIPRLASKMIADQLLHSWGQSWNPRIAGGLPFRAVKDITIQQQYMLEKAHADHTPYGGF